MKINIILIKVSYLGKVQIVFEFTKLCDCLMFLAINRLGTILR